MTVHADTDGVTVEEPGRALHVPPLPHAVPAARAGSSAPNDSIPQQPFSRYLWGLVEHGIFAAILEHPFLVGLADGTLDEAVFKGYLVQDALYLREYGRALALVASKAPRPDWVAFFSSCAVETFSVESGFHKEFMAYYNSTVEAEVAAAVRSPNNLGYTSYLLSAIHDSSFEEGLAAVLPCFVVYMEVGKVLQKRGSKHLLYQKWIDKYGGPEYEAIVTKVVHMVDELGAELTRARRARMAERFMLGCRWEYLFWDGAYRRQTWPC